ncbi:hypothetical protein ACHAPI_012032 [Fusarium lateritium]
MSDSWIVRKLERKKGEESSDKLVAYASRTILKIAGQWPWEFAAEFLPVNWTIPMLSDLRHLLQSIHHMQNPNLTINNYRRVKDVILGQARVRDYQHPYIIGLDLKYALRHFGIEPRRKQMQVPNGMAATMPATPMASSAPSALRAPKVPTAPVATMDDTDSSEQGSLFVSDLSSIIDERNSSPERKLSISSITSTSSNEDAPEPWKHPWSPAQRSETLERTRIVEPEEPDRIDIDDAVLNEAVTNDMVNPDWDPPAQSAPARTYQGPADLARGIESLEAKEKQEQKELAQNIAKLKALIQTKKASIADKEHMPAHNEACTKLEQDLKSHNQEKETLKRARVFFKQHCEKDMALDDESIAKNLRHYAQRLQACDETIKKTQAQIDQERQKSAQRMTDMKAQVEKDIAQVQWLEGRERHVVRNLEYYSVVKGLIKLGPQGMETLLTKLTYDNIPILKMVEEVQKKHNIS